MFQQILKEKQLFKLLMQVIIITKTFIFIEFINFFHIYWIESELNRYDIFIVNLINITCYP